MNWHAEKSNASVISLRIWYQQHFSVLSEFIERCSLASSLLVGKTFHLYAGFLIGFRDVITVLCVIAVLCTENRKHLHKSKVAWTSPGWGKQLDLRHSLKSTTFCGARARSSPKTYIRGCVRPPSDSRNIPMVLIWHQECQTEKWGIYLQPSLRAGDDV